MNPIVTENYYKLVEKSRSKVSWDVFLIILLLIGAFCGLTATIFFCHVLYGFSNNCVLYSKISFNKSPPKYANMFPNDMFISNAQTAWAGDLLCRFCALTWIGSFLVGVTLAVFFITSAIGASNPWQMILPTFLTSLLMCVCTGIAAGRTNNGFKAFCEQFESQLGVKSCTNRIDVYSLQYQDRQLPIAFSIHMTKLFATFSIFIWLLLTTILMIRICFAPDFTLQIITLKHERSKSEAEVETFQHLSMIQIM